MKTRETAAASDNSGLTLTEASRLRRLVRQEIDKLMHASEAPRGLTSLERTILQTDMTMWHVTLEKLVPPLIQSRRRESEKPNCTCPMSLRERGEHAAGCPAARE